MCWNTMKKASFSSDGSPTSEIQRLYRHVQQISQRLDMQLKQGLDWREWFDIENLQLRQRLREACEHIILSGECDIARKAEEYLWRRSFYDIIQKMKHDKRVSSCDESLNAVLISHLHGAMGFYHHLLVQLKSRFNIALQGSLDWIGTSLEPATSFQEISPEQMDWAFKACQRCLIYLGDLARYKLDMSAEPNPRLAERYYHLAILLNPGNGMPHNQIGTLKQNEMAWCEAAYHYMRCVLSTTSFEGADENLKRILEKNAQTALGLQQDCSQDITLSAKDQFVASFLALQEVLFGLRSVPTEELAQWCQSILNLFGMVLTASLPPPNAKTEVGNGVGKLKDVSQRSNNPSDSAIASLVSPVEMVKMFAISVMDTVKLKAIGSGILSAATAFTVALLSQLLDYTAQYLKLTSRVGSDETDGLAVNGKSSDEHYMKMKRRIVMNHRKRRRRRRFSSHSSGHSDSDGEKGRAANEDDELSDLSEGDLDGDASEELSEGTDSMVDEDLEDEGDAEVARISDQGKHLYLNGTISESERRKLASLSRAGILLNSALKKSKPKCHLSSTNGVIDDYRMDGVEFLNYAADLLDDFHDLNEKCFLPGIKVLLDFIRYHPDVLKMCGKTSPLLWQRLAVVLNALPRQKVIQTAVKYFSRRRRIPEWLQGDLVVNASAVQTRALSEDVALLGMPGFEDLHRSLDLTWFRGVSHSDLYQFALRVTYLRNFGHFVCDQQDVPCFSLADDGQTFLASSPSPTNVPGVIPNLKASLKQPNKVVSKMNQDETMKTLAKQKLQYEVSELEKNLSMMSVASPTARSAYLVLDCPALCRHLSLVRSLVKSGQFVVIIPVQVIAALDDLKKFNPGARDAIKFLEDEMKHGNRWLRAQKDSETVDDRVIQTNNRKKRNRDIEEWRFMQVVKCCLYFGEQHSAGSFVTLLTSDGHQSGGKTSMGTRSSQAMLEVCKTKGVQVELVVDFYKRWTTRTGPP